MARFLLFLIPQSLSLFGSSVLQFALIWTLVYEYSSGTMLLLSTLLGFFPQLVSSFLIGPMLDRSSGKRAIMLSDGISAAAAVVALAYVLGGKSDAVILLPLLAVRSLCQGVQMPAVNATVASLAPSGDLSRANGLKSLSSSCVSMLSPIAAALLFSLSYGLIFSLLLDAVTAIIAILVFGAQRIETGRDREADLMSGIRYMRDEKIILSLIVFNMLALFAISPGAFMTPLLLEREYGAIPSQLSFSELSFSIGMVAGGAFISARKIRPMSFPLFLIVYGLALLLIGIADSFPLYILFNFSIGLSVPCYSSLFYTAVQERTEAGMMGRTMAILSFSSSLAQPSGMILFGPLADAMPIRSVFILSGTLSLFIAIAGACCFLFRKEASANHFM